MSENRVKLGQYKGLTMKTRPVIISEKDIDQCLQMALEEAARTETITDRPVAVGDTVLLDFEGFADGVAFAGGKGENYPLVIGSGSFIDGFEEQLVGVEVGQEVRVNVTFPERYQAPELAGRPAVFVCRINGIQVKILPELTDEFVEMKYGCKTIAECRESLKEKMLDQRQAAMDETRIQTLVMRVVMDSEAQVEPDELEAMVEQQINGIRMNLMQQGLTLEQYFDMSGMTREQLLAEIRPQAEQQLKTGLVLTAIAEAEGIVLSREEVDEYLTGMAKNYGMTLEILKQRLDEQTLADITQDLLRNEAVRVILENAVEE